MKAIDNEVTRVDLGQLPIDMKRMLRVQIKELVHTIEDVEFEIDQQHLPNVMYSKIGRGLTSHHSHVA